MMINLKTVLKQAIAEINGFNSVFYGNDFETNAQKADDATYPLAQIVPPIASGVDVSTKTGRFRDRWTIFIFLCNIQPENMDASAEQNDLIIQAMRQKGKDLIDNLNKGGQFEFISKAEFKHLSFKFDATVSGVLMTFNAKDATGNIYC